MGLWKLLIDRASGNLVSVFSGEPTQDQLDRFDVSDVGDTRPDFSVIEWDASTRQMRARPVAQFADRLDDLRDRFLANPNFAAARNTLNATRRQQLDQGIREVLLPVFGRFRMRLVDEAVELDPPEAP